MPRYAVSKIQDALNLQKKSLNGSKVLIIGVAYKPDIDDLRESPALDIALYLKQKGAEVSYHDPYIPFIDHEGIELESVSNLNESIKTADCVAIITNHSSYDYGQLLEDAKLIVDTRNALGDKGKNNPKVVRL